MPTWTLVYQGFDPQQERLRESLCTLGNGYFCTRGAAEWADADDIHYPGTYLAGGYNRLTTEIAGRPIVNEDLVNMPNWLSLAFRIDNDDWFRLADVTIESYRQDVNLREGILNRYVRFTDAAGRETTVAVRRIVHMTLPHMAAVQMSVTPINWSGRLHVRSALDGRVINGGVARYAQLKSRHLEPIETRKTDEDQVCLLVRTSQSRLEVALSARTRFFDDDRHVLAANAETQQEEGYIAQSFALDVREGQTITAEKIVALYTGRDRAISEPLGEACTAVHRAGDFADLLHSHKLGWAQMWRRCDIEIEGDTRTQMILRVHIFHLLQTVSRNTIGLDVGVPARGLHGEAYRGHIFWDELFIFPFLDFRVPEITQALLMYRFRRLNEARADAREAGYAGAMFPWQSGSNGREETQSMHLNPKSGRWLPDLSRNQRHVNLAIAYNVWQFFQTTGNRGFMSVFGAELLFEITRFWASIATFNKTRGRYDILGVMGPDEYHEQLPDSSQHGLPNNAYTNVMVAWLMDKALQALDDLLPYRRDEIRETIGLTDDEISLWTDISNKMFVPFHDDGIISQFEGYENLLEFDWEGYRRKYGNIARLDRILEAEGDTPNRYKLSKQADVMMLFYLLSEEELARIFARLDYPFDAQTIPRNIDYYSARTSHGSTLSGVVAAAVTGRYDRAQSWRLFCEALESDVRDVQGGTTAEGIHLGAMAGTVDLVQRCYTGLEVRDGILFFHPRLPDSMTRVTLNLRFRGIWYDLTLTPHRLSVTPRALGEREPVKIGLVDEIYYLKPGYTREFVINNAT